MRIQNSFTLLLIVLLAGSCGRPSSESPSGGSASKQGAANLFQTSFQEESQYIIESVVREVAEMLYYCAKAKLPDPAQFSVSAQETGGTFESPTYRVRISLESKMPKPIESDLKLDSPIWSPRTYEAIASRLASDLGLKITNQSSSVEGTALLLRLTDGLATTIEKENQVLSKALEKDFQEPSLHEQAAVLLGALALREHSGYFYDIRPLLSRMTSHLILAHLFIDKGKLSVNGQMAEAMLTTLMNNQTAALGQLSSLDSTDAATTKWVRVLKARNTGDYRPLQDLSSPCLLERIAWFQAFALSANGSVAWDKTKIERSKTPDFCRITVEQGYSVETGNDLVRLSLPLELSEIASVYMLSQGTKLNGAELVGALNQLPRSCLQSGTNGLVTVKVIGWGQWGSFFHRHLCDALLSNFNVLDKKLGVHEDAAEFEARIEKSFGGLRLFPFVKRFNCTDAKSYTESVDQALAVTLATPQLVSAACWTYFYSHPDYSDLYLPAPRMRLIEWFKHTPPPGTAYDAGARLKHPIFVSASNMVDVLAKVHELAPYDPEVSGYLFQTKYHSAPTHEQAMELFGPIVAYSRHGMEVLAVTLKDQPTQYEEMLLKLATIDAYAYSELASYFRDRGQDDKAAEYYEKDAANNLDSIAVASYASWRVKYYLRSGRTNDARKVADAAAEVYSYAGLKAKAEFHEAIGQYITALDWYSKIEERYNDPAPLIFFCTRCKSKAGDPRLETALQRHLTTLFPQGMKKVSLNDFHSKPKTGVFVNEENDLTREAGLVPGDIIVATYGVQVNNMKQYSYARELSTDPELVLIVFHAGQYKEVKASPPGHRFGVDFIDVPPN